MRFRISTAAMFIVLLIASCASAPELLGIDLPLAEVPESVEDSTWGLPFLAEFPAGYWEEGAHRYRFILDCPVAGPMVESSPVEFRVTQLTPTLSGSVYLRMAGLSDGIMAPANVGAIHPTQRTTAAVTFLGLSEDVIAEATGSCEGILEFDGDQSEVISPGVPFRP